jgi:ferrous iron transport protein A
VQSSDGTNISVPLAQLARGEAGVVCGLSAVDGLSGDQAGTLLSRLRDLGFVAGARCEIVARMWPAGDPMAVRIGGSTFALRRVEADAVRVTRLASVPASRSPIAAKDGSAVTA